MYFPVLLSRAQVQYPVPKTLQFSPVEVSSPGGYLWRSASELPTVRRWALRFDDLTDAEAATLELLYESCAGGWRTFSFTDPLSNLFRWSEDIRNEAWSKSAGLMITASSSGGTETAKFQIVNTSAAPGRVWQELDVAPGAAICFSCEIRGGRITLRAGSTELTTAGSESWTRRFITAESSGGLQRMEMELAAGASVEVRRIQAETQRAPSEYQRTFERGGIHAKTRFADDGLKIVSVAPDRHMALVVLESTGEDEA